MLAAMLRILCAAAISLGPPTDPSPLSADEPSATTLLRGTECELSDPTSPLYPVAQALTTLRSGRFSLQTCTVLTDALRGRGLEVRMRGAAQDLLLYVLGNLATDGYDIEIAAAAPGELLVTTRVSPRGRQGTLRYVGVARVEITGEFLPGDSPTRLARIVAVTPRAFFPDVVAGQLEALGYQSRFVAVQTGRLRIEVRPGRSLRRIRIHGAAPLPRREIQRELSIASRPGSLAAGRCVHPRELRRKPRPPICDAADVACREWERDEVSRLEQFLFEAGYMRGKASLGLSCGRAPDEADLHVFLDKGPAHRIARRGVTVRGAPSTDQRWLRREFMPRFLLVRRKRVTTEFMEDRRERVEAAYAEPSRSQTLVRGGAPQHPHPQVRVRSSYEDFSPARPPADRNVPLEIDVDLGPAVEVTFTRPAESKTGPALSFTRAQLTQPLQIYARRDAPNQSVANREAANLRAFYQSRGFLFARVKGSYEDFGSRRKLRFEVAEGPRLRIRSLDLVGPQGVPPAVLERVAKRWQGERALRRRGRLSEAELLADLGVLLTAYNDEGYLCATASAKLGFWERGLDVPGAHAVVDPSRLVAGQTEPAWTDQFDPAGLAAVLREDSADLYVRLEVQPGPRVVTSRREMIRYLDEPIGDNRRVVHAPASDTGRWGAHRILHSTRLRPPGSDQPGGLPVTTETARVTAETITQHYRDDGFPVADAEVTWRVEHPRTGQAIELPDIRDLAAPQAGLCAAQMPGKPLSVSPVVHVYEGREGVFGDVLIRGAFKTRPWVLERELAFDRGDTYRRRHLDRSLARMQATGVSRGIGRQEYPVACDLADTGQCTVHEVITVDEAKDYFANLRFGVGSMTLNPLYVFAQPRFPNLAGTAWDLETEGSWGFDRVDWISDVTEVCGTQDSCFERSARATLRRPRILASGIDLDLTGQYRRRDTPARGRIDTAIGNLRLSWRLGEHWSFYGGYLLQLANISKDIVKPSLGAEGVTVVSRGEAIVPDRTGLLETGAVYTQVDNAFNPERGFILGAEGKFAFEAPYIGGNDWWARADLVWQQFIPIPRTRDRLSLRYSLRYGHAVPMTSLHTSSVPEVWRYFGGGTVDLGLRGILPETMLVDVETIDLPYAGTLYRPRAQGGHIRLLGSFAWQVVSIKDLFGGKLAHSIFYDAGFLTQRWRYVEFARDYRHSFGVNALKLDVELVTLALGYAVLVPTKQNVRPTDDANGRVVFDVGVTF
ncbi:MAG: hypothetical protein B7733_19455 [Myxococcales bacterium FL481]|nr:MAG: hypothetical protein B7733_19455 [Myxococcales bacterium FL481]